MINEKSAPNRRAGMYFDTGQKSRPLRQKSGQKGNTYTPESIRYPMIDNRMQSRV
jgi:hypothetical protein